MAESEAAVSREKILAHSKKTWEAPKVRRFETPEEVLEHYEKATPAERKKLEQLLEQMRNARERWARRANPRRQANG